MTILDEARERERRERSRRQRAKPSDNGEHGGHGEHESSQPKIVVSTREYEVNQQAVEALTREINLYQRGGLLVRVLRDGSPASRGIRRALAPRIDVLPPAVLRERLTACACWVSMQKNRQGEWQEVPAHPPGWCVSAVHARGTWTGCRYLEAVVDYPVLRPDGTILHQPGYDPVTGILLEPTGQFPVISPRPTRDDALKAVGRLRELVRDFPFETEAHVAAWFAALLTPLARFAFSGPAPLFLVDANVRGAGKGLLLDCIARIVTGERFTVATYTTDEDELRKRITAMALSGERLVLFDNLAGKFGGATLDAALTATAWKDRLLGMSRIVEAPLHMTWYATGNNVLIGADTARRTCHVRLESDQERPEERQDFAEPNLLAWVGEHRLRLLTDALTILSGYCTAGKPDMRLSAWGSFEGWSALVRAAVVWVGLPDPARTRIELQEQSDATAGMMRVLLDCWEQMDPDRRGLTAAEIISRLYPKGRRDQAEPDPEWYADMRDALEGMLGKPDTKALGYKLRAYRRRIFGGRYLDRSSISHHAVRWLVCDARDFSTGGRHAPHAPHPPFGDGGDGEHGEDNPPQPEFDDIQSPFD